MLRIYLAGPDVFLPSAVERGEFLKAVCEHYGFEGVFPLDGEEPSGDNKAADIFHSNIERIKSADIVVANLENFRGFEPDTGTVFECGVAYALGKPVFGYIPDDRPMVDRLLDQYGPVQRINGRPVDRDNLLIEDFDLPLNLMLGVPTHLVIDPTAEAGGFSRRFGEREL